MFTIPALISSKIAGIVGLVLLGVVLVMGFDIWWLGHKLDKAKADFAEAKAAYVLVADKLVLQNAAINVLGDRQKEAEARGKAANAKAAKTKAELDKALAKLNAFKPDTSKSACENAAALIAEAKK